MSKIVRDGWVVELDGAPQFEYGQKVRSKSMIRNDGTFPGKDIGEVLVKKGEEGYVISIGTFLQQYYIYGVEFLGSGFRVGMKRKELEPVELLVAGGGA
ncbi:MAG: nitrogen fixation protein NifZ [Terracidiphilus sp.]|jgi:nitrogen fixation protein NifZ